MELVLTVLTGLALSAACGFRVFVPPLIAGIAAMTGHLTLPDAFLWLGSWPAVLALGVAAVAEVGAYMFPLVDHALDVVAAPAAVVAGTLLTASFTTGMDPMLRWTLAIVAGGGLAGAVHTATGLTRWTSTATTAGAANPIFSLGELVAAVGLSLAAFVVPVAAVLGLLVVGLLLLQRLRRRRPRVTITRFEEPAIKVEERV
ncbi:MAG: hypothetical protein JWM80_5319 [Cyanobacteria bacterium RYN_339]|nr:hypothetical protein [Cyanobacteria bacterium RYN_339]